MRKKKGKMRKNAQESEEEEGDEEREKERAKVPTIKSETNISLIWKNLGCSFRLIGGDVAVMKRTRERSFDAMNDKGSEGRWRCPLPGLLLDFVFEIETLSEVFTRKSYFSLVPSEWREYFDHISEEEIHLLPTLSKESCECPPSLLNFMNLCEAYSLNRIPSSSSNFFLSDGIPSSSGHPTIFHSSSFSSSPSPSSSSSSSSSVSSSSSSSASSSTTSSKILPSAFLRGMSPKKLHEVQQMALYISQLCAYSGCSHVVDIGCGKAYFSQYLAFSFGLYVLGVEGNPSIQQSAISRTSSIAKECKRACDSDRISFTATRIDSSLQTDDFHALLSSHLPSPSTMSGIALCALHACGDLSSETLRIFVRQRSIRSLFLVGCCYNLLTEPSPNSRFYSSLFFTFSFRIFSPLVLGRMDFL